MRSASGLSARLRAALNVRRRLFLLFFLLLAASIAVAQQFWEHVNNNLAAEHSAAAAQAHLAAYNETYDAVMQYRVYLLRGMLAAVATPQVIDLKEDGRFAAAQAQVHDKLEGLSKIAPAESAAITALMPKKATEAIARVRSLTAAGDHETLAKALPAGYARFNQLHALVQEGLEHARAEVASANARTQAMHHRSLRLSSAIISAILLCGLVLSYFAWRGVVQPLHATMTLLRAIPGAPSTHSNGNAHVVGDEFDELAHALGRLRTSTTELNRLAYIHPLTALPNSLSLMLELERALGHARENGSGAALMFINLDNFRAINDAMGHDIGDACLQELAQRLRALTSARDKAFHYGGDLFAVYIEAPAQQVGEIATAIAARVHDAVARPVETLGQRLWLTASIGLALFPEHADDERGLVGAADAALHLAKRQGRDHTQLATRELAERAFANLQLTQDIQRGMAAAEFMPYYEPIVDLDEDTVVAAEALMRWRHPHQGLLNAAHFIEVAEQTGQLQPMSAKAFRKACAQFAQWPQGPRLAFNVAARQIRAGLPDIVQRVLSETGLAPERLELEITEGAVVDRIEQAALILKQLRDIGVGVVLDDFGTGYSSLSYLQRLPVSRIKIDRSFVSRLDSSRASQAIIGAMLGLARNLKLEVIAEGVETVAQAELLRAMGCRLMQGYLFSRALPAEAFVAWAALRPSEHLAGVSAADAVL